MKAGLDAYCAANHGEFDTHGTEATYRCVLARLRRAVWSPLLAAPHRLKLALLCATARTCQRFFGICNTYMCQHTFAGHTFPGGTPGPCRDITSPQGVLLKVEWHYRWGPGCEVAAVLHSTACYDCAAASLFPASLLISATSDQRHPPEGPLHTHWCMPEPCPGCLRSPLTAAATRAQARSGVPRPALACCAALPKSSPIWECGTPGRCSRLLGTRAVVPMTAGACRHQQAAMGAAAQASLASKCQPRLFSPALAWATGAAAGGGGGGGVGTLAPTAAGRAALAQASGAPSPGGHAEAMRMLNLG